MHRIGQSPMRSQKKNGNHFWLGFYYKNGLKEEIALSGMLKENTFYLY